MTKPTITHRSSTAELLRETIRIARMVDAGCDLSDWNEEEDTVPEARQPMLELITGK